MPDISEYNGIQMANIASINGQDVPAGSSGPSESNTGVLYFEGGGFNSRVPDAQEFYGEHAVSLYKAQLSTRTDIVRMKCNNWHMFALDSSNNLYSMGYTNLNRMGRAVNGDGHQLVQCLTNVAKFSPFDQGCWAIKTNGELWWCGNCSQFAASSDTGTGTTNSTNYGWSQFGSDTDWIDIDAYVNFPTGGLAIKGSTGSEYLYAAGSNYFGRLGVGTTSGSTKPWTRVKSDATTNWTETIAEISCGYNASAVVTKSGKFFAFGDANDGALGQGNTTDSFYPIQIGTDTDWEKPFMKSRLCLYAIKTDGSLYGSRRATFYFNIEPANSDRTYQQIGTDTDYEDLITIEHTASLGNEFIFAKKNGAWYANWDANLAPGFFMGNTSFKNTPGSNVWSSINQMLDGNDINVGINTVMLTFRENNQALGEVLLVATSAT
jgi:alpha-tubulin suppressor-like RCC1 family protein